MTGNPHAKETWQNVTRGSVGILRLDVRGIEYGQVVQAGGKVSLSADERRLNQDRAATPPQDLFSNGTLVPAGSWAAQLVSDDANDEYREIASNPNFMAESEMKELFKLRIDTFRKRLAEFQNPALVERVLELAHEHDAKASQVQAIKDRLSDFRPELLVEVESTGGPAPGPTPATP
jgi:hypothetical protein